MTQSPLIHSMMSSLSLSSLSPSLLVSALPLPLPLTIKLIISPHDIRRITIPTSVVSPYTYLISLIVNHGAQSYFTYQDDEGDTITVRTDDDLREALRITAGRTLRLTYHGTSHSHSRIHHSHHQDDDEGDDAAAEAEESFIYVDDDAGASPHAGIAMPVQVPAQAAVAQAAAPAPAPAPAPARPQQIRLGEMSPTVPGETHEGYHGWVEEGKATHPPTAEGVRLTPHHRHVPSAMLSVNIPKTPSKTSLPSSSSMPFDVYRSLASLPQRDGLAAASPKRPPPPPFLPILHRQCLATVKQAEDLYHTLYHECEETKRRLKHEMNAKMNTDSIEENNQLLEMYARDKAALEEKLQKNLSALLLRYEAYVGSFPNFTFLNPIYVHIGIHGRSNVRLETAVSPVSCLTDVAQQLQKYLTSIGERPYLHGSVIKCTLQKPNPHRTECDFELEDVTILLGDMHLPIGTRFTFYEDVTLVDAHYQAIAAKEEETHPLHTMSSASSSVAVSPTISPTNAMNVVTSNPSSPTYHPAPHPTFSLSSFAAGIMSLSTANSQLSAARSPALRSFSPVLPTRRHSNIDEKTRTPSTSSTERPRNFMVINPHYQPKTARALFSSPTDDVRMSRAASMPIESKTSVPLSLSHAASAPTTGEADHPEPESQTTHDHDDESVDGCDHSRIDTLDVESDTEQHQRSPSLTPGRMIVEEKHDDIPVDASQLYDLSPSSMLIVPEANDLTTSGIDMTTLSLSTPITPLDASGIASTPLGANAAAVITPLDASAMPVTPLDATMSVTSSISVGGSMMASAVAVTPMEASALGGSHVWIDPTKSLDLP